MSEAAHNEALDLHHELEPLYSPPQSRFGFLAATNHSIVGIRFMVTAIAFFLIGGVLAMLMRAQLAGPATQFLDPGQYAQVFTMHGAVMMRVRPYAYRYSSTYGAVRRGGGANAERRREPGILVF